MAAVRQLAEYHGRSPDQLSLEEVRDWIHHVMTERHLADASVNVKIQALRFLCQHVLNRNDFNMKAPTRGSQNQVVELPEPFGDVCQQHSVAHPEPYIAVLRMHHPDAKQVYATH